MCQISFLGVHQEMFQSMTLLVCESKVWCNHYSWYGIRSVNFLPDISITVLLLIYP